MDVIEHLSVVDTQALSSAAIARLIESCHQLLRKAQVSAHLRDALVADQSDFTGFSNRALHRLSALLQAHREGKAGELQVSDPLTLVIVGLCLSTRNLARMSVLEVAELFSQATSLGRRRGKVFLRDKQILLAVTEGGSDDIIRSYRRLVADDALSTTLSSLDMQFEGTQCVSYIIPHGIQFGSLTALATTGTVTAYIPTIYADCCVRFATLFNENLLRSLFGYQLSVCDIGPFPLLAMKDQIASVLGEGTFSAIQTSFAWVNRPDLMTTECVKGMVYAGHIIVVDVLMNRDVCANWVNSALST